MELRLARAQLLEVVLLGPPRDLWVWLLGQLWMWGFRQGRRRLAPRRV